MSTISAISSSSSAMIGEAPTARAALAQSFVVTMFVMQCVSGFLAFTFSIAPWIASKIS